MQSEKTYLLTRHQQHINAKRWYKANKNTNITCYLSQNLLLLLKFLTKEKKTILSYDMRTLCLYNFMLLYSIIICQNYIPFKSKNFSVKFLKKNGWSPKKQIKKKKRERNLQESNRNIK